MHKEHRLELAFNALISISMFLAAAMVVFMIELKGVEIIIYGIATSCFFLTGYLVASMHFSKMITEEEEIHNGRN